MRFFSIADNTKSSLPSAKDLAEELGPTLTSLLNLKLSSPSLNKLSSIAKAALNRKDFRKQGGMG
jgi:hypothetical protein